MIATLEKYAPWMLGVLRIVTALVFMEHGTQKFFHFPASGAPPGGRQGAQAALGAAKSAVDQAASTMSSMIDTASSMLASAPPPTAARAAGSGSTSTVFLIAAIIETFGGLALILGLLTRPIAFLVAGETAVIFWWMHVGRSGTIFPASNGGEPAVLFCFTFLYLVFAGPGAFALDNVLFRKRAV